MRIGDESESSMSRIGLTNAENVDECWRERPRYQV